MSVVTLVEDDRVIRTAITDALVDRGHKVWAVGTALGALSQIIDNRPDIVVLDLGLPDMGGLELLKMLRAVTDVPVIVATAIDEERSIIQSLDAGADDYVVKPYSADELDARIRAVLRRGGSEQPPTAIKVGGLVLDESTRTASVGGRPLTLSRKEFDLLSHLAARAGRVVTKRELMARVWQQPFGGGDKTIDVHLSWVRRKLAEVGPDAPVLRTVRGVGVMLVDPAAE